MIVPAGADANTSAGTNAAHRIQKSHQFFIFTHFLVYSKKAEMYIELLFDRRLRDRSYWMLEKICPFLK